MRLEIMEASFLLREALQQIAEELLGEHVIILDPRLESTSS